MSMESKALLRGHRRDGLPVYLCWTMERQEWFFGIFVQAEREGTMAEMIRVAIPLDDQAPVTVEGIGYTGPGCAKEIDAVLAILGGEAERTKTGDYYKQVATAEKVRAS